MKKVLFLFLAITLLFTHSVFASPTPTNKISEKDFLKMVQKSKEYKEYKHSLLSKDYILLNPVLKENGEEYGWIVQYEITYNENNSSLNGKTSVSFSSLLTFAYDYVQDTWDTYIIDYSRLYTEKMIYVINMEGEELTSVNIEGEELFEELFVEIEEKQDAMLDNSIETIDSNSDEPSINSSNYLCWQCTNYSTSGGIDKCPSLVGAYCSFGSNYSVGSLLCAGTTIVSCYTPPYKVCTAGVWKTSCPVS